jgi:hypothetical protein
MNPFPCWIYKAHSTTSLRIEVLHVLKLLEQVTSNANSGGAIHTVTDERVSECEVDEGKGYQCPIRFSYQVAAQMILSDAERQSLLEATHVCRLR